MATMGEPLTLARGKFLLLVLQVDINMLLQYINDI